ncbi:sodium-dependent transporter [Prevotella sp.]|uniref:sodium-dependent transporter n=1 Tax=Prevotella sp. TaxID=59823 RepID=UPI002F9284A4
MSHGRASFGSKIGMILATAGGAVGLGNVWRFPYMTGENGGAAFILVYLCCVFVLGIPCMISEFIIGRHGSANTYRAFAKLSPRGSWKLVGLMGVLTGYLITGYYAVVSGWCLQYVYASVMGELKGNPDYVLHYFQSFSSNPIRPVFWTVAILLLAHFIIIHGIRGGIEKASKLLMPTLFILLLVIVGASLLLPNAGKGVEFLLKPDFGRVDRNVFLGALGQSFYSLSIAMGCMCTYASYYSRSVNLLNSSLQIAAIDTFVAILAGLMIFPAAFSVGVNPGSGPSLIFITLPNVFNQAFSGMPMVGWLVSLMFYTLLALAALTSLMSLHEVSTAFIYEELHISRKRGAVMVTVTTCIIGAFCSLSLGAVDFLSFGGKSLFDWFDFVTGQIFLPVGGLLTCLFLGWFVPRQIVRDEFTNWGTVSRRFFGLYLFLVRYFCPLAILAILLHQFSVI